MRQFLKDHDLRSFSARNRLASFFYHRWQSMLIFGIGMAIIFQIAFLSGQAVKQVTENQDRNFDKTSQVLSRLEDLQKQNNQLSQQIKAYSQCLADLQVKTSQGAKLTSADIENCNSQAEAAAVEGAAMPTPSPQPTTTGQQQAQPRPATQPQPPPPPKNEGLISDDFPLIGGL